MIESGNVGIAELFLFVKFEVDGIAGPESWGAELKSLDKAARN